MPTPVVEQIAQKIANRLATITADNDYAITVASVVRPVRRNQYSLTDGTAVLRLDSFEEGTPETAESGVKLRRTAVWTIDYATEPSDDSTTPLDELQATAIAEIERALAEDFYLDSSDTFAGPGGFAGIGNNAELRPPQLINDENGDRAGVRVTIAVGYAHTDKDPYTALP